MTAALTPEIGAALPALTVEPISRTTLALFAGASGDHNPMHIDIDAARAAGMDDVFAHGMLSMAYLGRLLTQWVPLGTLRTFDARFTAMTPVLARPSCTGHVVSVEDTAHERRVEVALAVTLDDGTTTVTGSAVVGLPHTTPS